MAPTLLFALATTAALLLSAGALHLSRRMGALGDLLSRAPALDLVVFYFTHGPWVAAAIVWWQIADHTFAAFATYFALSLAAQAATLLLWSRAHEAAHPGVRKGPRIVSTLNRRVGFARNHLAVWWTSLAVPLFTLVRFAEIFLYPPLTWLVRLPKYPSGDWINVSRQKFSGLVGYDLIWCLYCDWMTGVWSLGSEMLRNVESFWCPIRFSSPEKCANCQTDFPDLATTWIAPPPGGDMAKVTQLLESQYPGPRGINAWHGHPVRLTVKGRSEPRP